MSAAFRIEVLSAVPGMSQRAVERLTKKLDEAEENNASVEIGEEMRHLTLQVRASRLWPLHGSSQTAGICDQQRGWGNRTTVGQGTFSWFFGMPGHTCYSGIHPLLSIFRGGTLIWLPSIPLLQPEVMDSLSHTQNTKLISSTTPDVHVLSDAGVLQVISEALMSLSAEEADGTFATVYMPIVVEGHKR